MPQHKATAILFSCPDCDRELFCKAILIYIYIEIISGFFDCKFFAFLKKGPVFVIGRIAGFFAIDEQLTIIVFDRIFFFFILLFYFAYYIKS